MTSPTRILVLTLFLAICAGGAIVAEHSVDADPGILLRDAAALENEYALVATGGHEFAFNQLESIIRHEKTAMAHRGRIEFGAVKVSGGKAMVQVLFVTIDGGITPYLYTLTAHRDSWKIERVQQLWFVPRGHMLRGVRA
jgi:hypothetical protein